MDKTPITILQEFAIKKGYVPNYNYIGIQGNGQFIFKVNCENLSAQGSGSNKKAAKQNAAQQMLMLLDIDKKASMSPLSLSNMVQNCVLTDVQASISNISNPSFNYIGQLQEYCMSHDLLKPTYEVIDEDGLSHKKIFTVQVNVGPLIQKGMAQCKKSAKQEAAKNLLKCLVELHGFDNRNKTSKRDNANKVREDLTNKKSVEDHLRELGVGISDLKNSEPSISIAELSQKAQAQYIESNHKITKRINTFVMKDCHFLFKSTYSSRISDSLKTKLRAVCTLSNYQKVLIQKIRHEIETAVGLKLEQNVISMSRNSTMYCMVCVRLLSTPIITQFGMGKTKEEAESRAVHDLINTILKLLE